MQSDTEAITDLLDFTRLFAVQTGTILDKSGGKHALRSKLTEKSNLIQYQLYMGRVTTPIRST